MNDMTFEQALDRLEEIVKLLENGKTPLDDSMKLFDEGTGLVAFCSQTLKTAEQKILQINEIQMEA